MSRCPECGGKLMVVGEEIIWDYRSIYVYECRSCHYIFRHPRKPTGEEGITPSIIPNIFVKEKVIFT